MIIGAGWLGKWCEANRAQDERAFRRDGFYVQ
jgi:hypothetical protein